jgi:hypothetical protein
MKNNKMVYTNSSPKASFACNAKGYTIDFSELKHEVFDRLLTA